MTYEVQQTRWDRIIRRVSGSIGPGSRVSETLSELFPVLDVERVPAELLLLGGTQVCMGQVQQSATVGEFSLAMLLNPVGSGNLITVTRVVVSTSSTQQCNAGITQNVFPTAGTQTIRDGRRGPAGVPVGQVLSATSMAIGVNFFRFFSPNNQNAILEDPNDVAVLSPGSAFALGTLGTNADLRVGFFWRERPGEESELQF